MLFYKPLLAALAAIVIASPVFADDATGSSPNQTQSPPAASEQQENLININSASVKVLMRVKGINASKARAIVAYRKKHGNFKTLDDLSKVKGFTKMRTNDLQAIQDQLTM